MKLFPRILKFTYYCVIVSAFCANMIVVSHTTALSVLGAGMALRGPDGSMMTATDGLYEERKTVFFIFGVGLACTVGSVVIIVWIILQWESAICCMMIALITCRTIWRNYQRVQQRFDFDESETVDFRDIMEGPAAIQAMPMMTMMQKSAATGKAHYTGMSALYRGNTVSSVGNATTSTRNGGNDYSYWMKKTKTPSLSLPIDTTMGDDFRGRDRDATTSSDTDYRYDDQGSGTGTGTGTRTSPRPTLLERKRDQTRQRRGRSSSPKDLFIQTV